MTTTSCAILVSLLATTLLSPIASASTVDVSEKLPAANACQGSLPQFAGTLRARPLGLGNEGSATAFVTCGANGSVNFGRLVSSYSARFTNRGSETAAITCTGVVGTGDTSSQLYSTRTFTVAAGTSATSNFTPANFGIGDGLNDVQFNCSLPAGTEINFILIGAKVLVTP